MVVEVVEVLEVLEVEQVGMWQGGEWLGSEGGRAAWSASSHPAGSGAIPTVRAST
jgi:hypothetical protein